MNEVKKNWANTEHYEAVRVLLKEQEADTKNPYLYEKVLKQSGLDTFMGDLKPWIKSLSTDVSTLSIKVA